MASGCNLATASNVFAQQATNLSIPEFKNLDFKGGDMSTSIIKMAPGRTIMMQWDGTSPRAYSRLNLIQGTKDTLVGFPNRIAIEGMGELAERMGGHGGREFAGGLPHHQVPPQRRTANSEGL